ncbi:glycosyltransferase N-terminal domain-containing protein [Mucilaginibacter gynuensis]|uniref:3-deoxy-D-manno-octulosonic acid transferase n=1 Tax=Mucilaginibacter gynuensis TaxID=1302236 RepID=A0ABP8HAD8_9SPHI
MMLLYNLGVRLYYLAVYIASFFNKKAKLWITGRKNQTVIRCQDSIWFHFASLGEFEQGRPVLEKMREQHPGRKIVVTFFSPSGYEIRKNTPLADAVYYLPLDTPANARNFIDAIQPTLAVFTKYEYWYHYFKALHQRNIPLYIVSGIFRPKQVFFKWYGGLHRKMLTFVSHFFLQDERSTQLLQAISITNTTVSGDTRFDRVWANAQSPRDLPVIKNFINGKNAFVCGSTWPEDEKLLAVLVAAYPDWKFVIAPHEIGEEKISRLLSVLPQGTAISHSELVKQVDTYSQQHDILIIDNIGMLSSLYQYGRIAYIGGGFGAGIHNTLEAAAFGLPVIFGTNYQNFKEACDLIALRGGFSISNETELIATAKRLTDDAAFYEQSSATAKRYVDEQKGATEKILKLITV